MRRYHRRRRGKLRRVSRPQAYSQYRVSPAPQKPRPRRTAATSPRPPTAVADDAAPRRAVARGSLPTRPSNPTHGLPTNSPHGGAEQSPDSPLDTSPPSSPHRPVLSGMWLILSGALQAPVKAGSRRVFRSHSLFLRSQQKRPKRRRSAKYRHRSPPMEPPPTPFNDPIRSPGQGPTDPRTQQDKTSNAPPPPPFGDPPRNHPRALRAHTHPFGDSSRNHPRAPRAHTHPQRPPYQGLLLTLYSILSVF